MGGAPEGTWIVATPGGPFSHAVYADKDYRGYLALLARRQAADARRGRRDDLVRVALGVMVAAGTSVGDEDLAVLAHAAVGALLPGMSGD
jgi:hypothetical protein